MAISNIRATPRLIARITGGLYLMTIVAGIFAQVFISNKLITFSDATVTANNILARQSLYQMGLTVYLVEMACQIAVTALFYFLLKPVSPSVALVSAFFGLGGSIMKTLSRVFYFAPLFVLGGGHSSGRRVASSFVGCDAAPSGYSSILMIAARWQFPRSARLRP